MRGLLVAAITTAALTASCRSTDELSSGSQVLNAGGPACGGMTALSTTAMKGKDVFDISSTCVFNREVHDVRIRILSETFKKVLDDGCADRDSGYGHIIEAVIDGHKIPNVGIKVRGNTSRCNDKRQFGLKFDEEEMYSVWAGKEEKKSFPENDGRLFFGLEAISLRASGNDPSMVRERISSRVITQAESLAPTAERGGLVYRVAFAKVYISFNRKEVEGAEGNFRTLKDGYYYDYKGLYSLAESIDKTFVNSRFQIDDEKLRFHLIQADLAKLSFQPGAYDRKGFKARYVGGGKVKTEADLEKADKAIAELTALLNSNPSDADLAALVDIDNIVNYYSGVMLTGHWDSMVGNRNNDYLFFNPKTKKWQIIVWDLDNTLGVIYDLYKVYMRDDIYNIARKQQVKLFTEVFRDTRTANRDKLKDRLRGFFGGVYRQDQFNQMVDQLKSQVMSAAEPWEGIRPSHFEDLKQFAESRRSKIGSQLK